MPSPIKLKVLLEYLETEASLSGMSRSGGAPNWDHYIVRDFDPEKIHTIEADTDILDTNKSKIGAVKKGENIKIMGPELTQIGGSKYATIKQIQTDLVGLVKIATIKKPSTKGSGVFGGTNSKEFLPDKLGLMGKSFVEKGELLSATSEGLNDAYGDDKYLEIRTYLTECMDKVVGGGFLTEAAFSKQYTLSKSFKINDGDIKILSKNFGEIIAALYTLANNKKAEEVEFSSEANSPFYDFIMLKENGVAEYFSVKSFGGSSTSMANLNFLLDHFSEDNIIFDEYKTEVEVIRSLMNNKKEGVSTLNNIEGFFDDHLPEKKTVIISKLNQMSKSSSLFLKMI